LNETRIITKTEGAGLAGALWFAGWLFTIGYLKLQLVKGAMALVLWPYFLGAHFGR
jgi:hypothetical protein